MGKLFRKNVIKTDIDTCWEFFKSPENLLKITPKHLDLRIKDHDGMEMHEGQLISYVIKSNFGFDMQWITKIKSVSHRKEFVDIQLKGPYKIWHHRHIFKETETGVEMIDVVHYKLPFGIFGKIIERLIIRKRVNEIFDYRDSQIMRIFQRD